MSTTGTQCCKAAQCTKVITKSMHDKPGQEKKMICTLQASEKNRKEIVYFCFKDWHLLYLMNLEHLTHEYQNLIGEKCVLLSFTYL